MCKCVAPGEKQLWEAVPEGSAHPEAALTPVLSGTECDEC